MEKIIIAIFIFFFFFFSIFRMKFSRFRHVGNFCTTVSQVFNSRSRKSIRDPRGNSACYSELSSTWMKRGTEIATPRGKHRGERKGANRALFFNSFPFKNSSSFFLQQNLPIEIFKISPPPSFLTKLLGKRFLPIFPIMQKSNKNIHLSMIERLWRRKGEKFWNEMVHLR